MAYFYPDIFGLLYIYPDAMIGNVILRGKVKVKEVEKVW